jgi:hypothetical protein
VQLFALLPAVMLDPGGSWTMSVLPGVAAFTFAFAFTLTAVAAATATSSLGVRVGSSSNGSGIVVGRGGVS